MLTYAIDMHNPASKDSCEPAESMAEKHLESSCQNTAEKFDKSLNMNDKVDTIELTNLGLSNNSVDEEKVTENEYSSTKISLQECYVVLRRLSNRELNSRLLKVQTSPQPVVLQHSDNPSQKQSLHNPVTPCKPRKRGRKKMNEDFHTELNAKKLKLSSESRNNYKVNVNRVVTKFKSLDRFFLVNKKSRKFEVAKAEKLNFKKFSDTKISDYFTRDTATNKFNFCESAKIGSAEKPFDAGIVIKIENVADTDKFLKQRHGLSKDLRVCLINMKILGISSPPFIVPEVERLIADYAWFSRYPVEQKVMHCSSLDQSCQNVESNFSPLRTDETEKFVNSSSNLTPKTAKDNVFTTSSRKKRNQKSTLTQFFQTLKDPVTSCSHDSFTNQMAPIESGYDEKRSATNTPRHRNSFEESDVPNLQSDDLGTVAQSSRSDIICEASLLVKNEPDSGSSCDKTRVVPDEIDSPNSRNLTNPERMNSTIDQSQPRSLTRPWLSASHRWRTTSTEFESSVTDFSNNISSCETSQIGTTPKKGSNSIQRLEIQSNEECIISKTTLFTPETEQIDEVLRSEDVTNTQNSVQLSKNTSIRSSESCSRKSFEKSIEEICSIIGVTPKSRPTCSSSTEESSRSVNREIDQVNLIDKLKNVLSSETYPNHRDKCSADVGISMSTELQIEPADSTSTIDLPIAPDVPVPLEGLPVVEPTVTTDKRKNTTHESNLLEEKSLPDSEKNTSSVTDERVADSADADFNRENESKGIIYKRKCSICYQLFTSAGMLKKHLSHHFKDEDPEQCIICDQPLRNSVVQHYFKHCTLVVACPTCNKVFKHKGILKIHMTNEKHGRDLKIWKCDVCSMTCDTKEGLFSHVFTHSATDLQDAYQAAKTKQQLQEGEKTNENARTKPQNVRQVDVDQGTPRIVVQEKRETSDDLVICEPDIELLTGSTTTQKSTEKMFICSCHRNHHLEITGGIIMEIAMACQQCNLLYKTNQCFSKHLENKTCYENFEKKTSAKIYCGSCCLVLHSLQEMHSHLDSHAQKQSLMKVYVLCELCQVMFYGMGSMFYTHWFNHCKDSKFRADPNSFPEHMKVNVFDVNSVNWIVGQNLFIADHVCTLCKNPFYSEQELKKHFNTETKTCSGGGLEVLVKERYRQPYKLMCSICSEEFSAKSKLDDHVRSHETVGDLLRVPEYYVDHTHSNRFICEFCKTTLKSVAECDEHSLKHKVIQEKFVCGICIVMFDDMDDFQNHLSNHKRSARKPVSCQIVFATCKYYCKKCKLLFEDGDSLHQHSLDHDKSLLPIDTWNQQTSAPLTNNESSVSKTAVINEILGDLVQGAVAKCSRVETQINYQVEVAVDKPVDNSEQADCHLDNAVTRQSPPNEQLALKPSFLRVKKLSDLIEQKPECNICKAKFATQSLLAHHRCDPLTSVPEITSKPAKEIFICQACHAFETTDPLQLRIHVMLHFPLDAYPKLNEHWYSAWRLTSGKHHLKCKLCQTFQTMSLAALQEHFLVVHATIYQPMFKCRMCRDFMTFDSHKIQQHERTHFVSSNNDELPNFIRNNVKILSSKSGTPSSQIQDTSSPAPKLSLIYQCPICKNFECTSEQQFYAHCSTQHPNDASRIKFISESPQNRTPSSGSCSSENRQPWPTSIAPHQSTFGVLKQNGTPTVTVQVTNKPSMRSDVISIPRIPKPAVPSNQQRWRLKPDQNVYPYTCSLCFCRFLHEAEFLQHQQQAHPPTGVTTIDTSKIFQCDLCNLCSVSVDQLQFHKRVQHGSWY